MAERRVTQTGNETDGDITALCNPAETWSPPRKNQAINDIEAGIHPRYVGSGTTRVNVHVVNGPTGKYVRTDPDPKRINNLDNLSDR